MAQPGKIDEPTTKVDVPVSDRQFKKGTSQEAPIPLPDDGLEYVTEIENPARDPGVAITVINEVSEDGGLTWHDFGGFTRAPGPWVDRDGNPITKTGVKQELFDGEGNRVSVAPGGIIRSKVITDKNLDAKLSHAVDVKTKPESPET